MNDHHIGEMVISTHLRHNVFTGAAWGADADILALISLRFDQLIVGWISVSSNEDQIEHFTTLKMGICKFDSGFPEQSESE